ncbi:MAG: S41 family peptidase [Clostridia bacterium]|nr:S41 family peptidase [Clostridia bacterium]
MKNNNDKRVSAGETILWMVITAATVFVVTSFQYTKMTLGNDGGYDTSLYSGDNFKKLEKVLSIVEDEFLYEYDMKTLEEGAIRGMLEALDDPYTSYFDVSETEEFLTESEGEYEGVGMYMALDTSKGLPIVLMPIEGSPAEEAGILPGDYIIELDGKDVTGASLEEVAGTIKGVSGSTINIKFIRYTNENEYEEFEKTLTRRKVEINSFDYEILDNNIAYISFSSFDEKADKHFKDAIKEMKKDAQIEGLIIDIRDNTGGLLSTAAAIIDEILPTGVITYTVDKNGKKEYIYSDSKTLDIPVVVVVNGYSASASEIMAGAIKDYEKGAVVGTTTYGKGLVQEFKSLRDGTYVKITIAEYFSPSGQKINELGVEPDYVVENGENVGEDLQLNKAIEVIKEMINKK